MTVSAYSLLDANRVKASMALLADAMSIDTDRPLGERYVTALSQVQPPQRTYLATEQVDPAVAGISERADDLALLAPLSKEHRFESDAAGMSTTERDIRTVKAALSRLKGVAAPSYETVRLLVGRVLVAASRTSEGGSAGGLLGTIWTAPKPNQRVDSICENILHETLHQSLFLEEMVRGVFGVDAERQSQPDALVTSSIRADRRPYYLAFHSAAVSAGLLYALGEGELADQVDRLRPALDVTLLELRERDWVLDDNGKRLLGELESIASPQAAVV